VKAHSQGHNILSVDLLHFSLISIRFRLCWPNVTCSPPSHRFRSRDAANDGIIGDETKSVHQLTLVKTQPSGSQQRKLQTNGSYLVLLLYLFIFVADELQYYKMSH